MDPRVPQADRNFLQRPLVSSRIQRDRHRCSSAQCGEHKVVGRWPAVRTPRRNGLIRGQAMIAGDDFLNEARGAPTDDHEPLIAGRCTYSRFVHWESPSDLRLSALSICSVSAAQSLFCGQNLQTCSPPSGQDRFHEFFWEPFEPHLAIVSLYTTLPWTARAAKCSSYAKPRIQVGTQREATRIYPKPLCPLTPVPRAGLEPAQSDRNPEAAPVVAIHRFVLIQFEVPSGPIRYHPFPSKTPPACHKYGTKRRRASSTVCPRPDRPSTPSET